MPVPYTFGTATAAIPLSQLDSNFSTAITIGNTAVQLGNTVTTLNNMTLANVTISSGNVTLTNVSVTTANVSGTANVSSLVVLTNETVLGNTSVTGNVSTIKLTSTNDATISGLTVGKGAGSVSTNTAVGASALFSNTANGQNTALGYNAGYYSTGSANTYVGYNAGPVVTSSASGSYNTSLGAFALQSNTTASNNTAVGYQAGYSNTTGTRNVFLGYQAGYTFTVGTTATYGANVCIGSSSGYSLTSGISNVLIGDQAGYGLTTGIGNTFIGGGVYGTTNASGGAITTGSKNSILGNYSGNQGGLDIRTASNYIVLSDGDGNPRGVFDSSGNLLVGTTTGSNHYIAKAVAQGSDILGVISSTTNLQTAYFSGVSGSGENAAATAIGVRKNSSTSRSINAAGTINASGADYAEYMTKAGNFTIAKGDVVGIDAQGKLTNVFADAVSFMVKSTDPSYVGGDVWGSEEALGLTKPTDESTQAEKDAFNAALEAARQQVDRIAFAGQVPVNVMGATAGQYIIPVNDNGAIKGEAVSNPTFEQYQISVGKVIAIESDGRAKIIVKVA